MRPPGGKTYPSTHPRTHRGTAGLSFGRRKLGWSIILEVRHGDRKSCIKGANISFVVRGRGHPIPINETRVFELKLVNPFFGDEM